MCDQCLCGFKEFGEVVPGWDLLQANEDGIVVKQGNWVLARRITSDGKPQYELAYTWNRAPLADPFKGDGMAWGKAMDEVPGKEGERVSGKFDANLSRFELSLQRSGPIDGFFLISACLEAGYRSRMDFITVARWLFHRMGLLVESELPKQ